LNKKYIVAYIWQGPRGKREHVTRAFDTLDEAKEQKAAILAFRHPNGLPCHVGSVVIYVATEE